MSQISSRIKSIFGNTDSFVENNPTIIRRKGAERFYRTPFQKVGDAGYVLMSAVDDVTTEFIVRAKYNEFIKKGMSEQQAITEADKWTSRLMGDRSLGQMPQIYNSKTLGLITQFQLEVRNQLDSQFYDTIQEAKASNEDIQNRLERSTKTAARVTKTFFELSCVLCITAYLGVALLPIPALSLVCCALCGLSVGIMWPGTFGSAAALLKGGSTAMFALLALSGDLGCSLGPSVVGFVSGVLNDNLKMGILAAVIFPALLLLCISLCQKNKTNKKP